MGPGPICGLGSSVAGAIDSDTIADSDRIDSDRIYFDHPSRFAAEKVQVEASRDSLGGGGGGEGGGDGEQEGRAGQGSWRTIGEGGEG